MSAFERGRDWGAWMDRYRADYPKAARLYRVLERASRPPCHPFGNPPRGVRQPIFLEGGGRTKAAYLVPWNVAGGFAVGGELRIPSIPAGPFGLHADDCVFANVRRKPTGDDASDRAVVPVTIHQVDVVAVAERIDPEVKARIQERVLAGMKRIAKESGA